MPPSLRLAVAVVVAMVLRAVTVATAAMGSRTGPTARGGWPGVVRYGALHRVEVMRRERERERGGGAVQTGRGSGGGEGE